MDFFVWQGCSRGFGSHAIRLRNGLRLQAQMRPARARRQHSELCNDEQRCQAEKDAIYARRFSLTDY